MTELNNLKIKAIAETIKQTGNDQFEDLMVYVSIFKDLRPKDQLKWVTTCEEHYTKQLPKEGQVPNLYEIGKAYLRWQVFLDLFNNGFEIKNLQPE